MSVIPDFTELGATSVYTRDEWRQAWDDLVPAYRTSWYWPALLGMQHTFGLKPTACAAIINTLTPEPAAEPTHESEPAT